MSPSPRPAESNGFLVEHCTLIRHSYRHWLGRDLVSPELTDGEAARVLFDAPFALLTHDTRADPVFNYANATALELFGMTWEQMCGCPSRLSAEAMIQSERERLLTDARERGYSEGYRGIRISRDGRRFEIREAVVWNLIDAEGLPRGQAACFGHWTWL